MLIQNYNSEQTHGDTIKHLLSQCEGADLMVSYIKFSGAKFLESSMKDCLTRGGKVRILCTLDMEISQPEAIKRLITLGVKIKTYSSLRGNYHPKMWIFSDSKGGKCLVGSANMSESAMLKNVEISSLLQGDEKNIASAKEIFKIHWNSKEAVDATDERLDEFIAARKEREKAIRAIQRQEKTPLQKTNFAMVEKYITSWIEIGANTTASSGERLWRGWYIIPDQGYVDDDLMHRLHLICAAIGSHSLDISKKSSDPRLDEIYQIVAKKLGGKKDKMSLRDLFIRQEKNYLIKFGFAYHLPSKNGKPDKSRLRLTAAGRDFAAAKTNAKRKEIYSREIQAYMHNGLETFNFVEELLSNVDYITFIEFNYFVCHAYSDKEMAVIIQLINAYRALSEGEKQSVLETYIRLFNKHLEPTAKGVRGNYEKKVRHTMSVFGWCTGMALTERTEGSEQILTANKSKKA